MHGLLRVTSWCLLGFRSLRATAPEPLDGFLGIWGPLASSQGSRDGTLIPAVPLGFPNGHCWCPHRGTGLCLGAQGGERCLGTGLAPVSAQPCVLHSCCWPEQRAACQLLWLCGDHTQGFSKTTGLFLTTPLSKVVSLPCLLSSSEPGMLACPRRCPGNQPR